MEESDLPGSHPNEQNQQPTRTPKLWFSSSTSVHITALDGIVNVNALFTVAVFIGLSLTPNSSDQNRQSNNNKSPCIPDNEAARNLVVYDVVSFSFFLFSSVIAVKY
ncbi:unnamed protein product [Ilex paraguariensis]|uniref:Uncharacterized protein n=1 Tax=Ilex paraguariensis TaxID=185542 RepID=A0ABC8R774_9AQUA